MNSRVSTQGQGCQSSLKALSIFDCQSLGWSSLSTFRPERRTRALQKDLQHSTQMRRKTFLVRVPLLMRGVDTGMANATNNPENAAIHAGDPALGIHRSRLGISHPHSWEGIPSAHDKSPTQARTLGPSPPTATFSTQRQCLCVCATICVSSCVTDGNL